MVYKRYMQTQTINEDVSVSLVFNHHTRVVAPMKVSWRGRVYTVKKVGLHHKFREGRTLIHIFSVITDSSFLRLAFNSETLNWKLEQIIENQA